MISPYIFPGISSVLNKSIMNEIIKVISTQLNVNHNDVIGDRRYKTIVYGRHLSMYYIRKKTKLSEAEIGKYFNRDHSTINHACKVINNYIYTKDNVVLKDIQILNKKFGL
jgi:chromosomal replication initiator protein